ncbi:dipeptide epimerase [Pseudobacter ginsenosidimutans]|jgi:L-alanine-DL-glutamate epimerase-like enolase superfamily enzyme|uniref:Dipeptide epimerase n=1 Tax=Pseudobacter ginsenosidimutans TaxID=661488 RepID=A0A4Q7N424_9BACT|nr:dipeptide epimerase [Pseudobacter ginsenosidimutans]QEC44274.1 dipeptide epimerase [Pseudobacter ginsenosidimutans]RZS75735.1 L-alanine-DL-glutamate epimerase-like enolase superfamily enzyme [Pseudobacter ginsenosidimutans]
MKVTYQSQNLPFRYPFTISKGTKTHQPSLIVTLDHRGITGLGEAPAITYYNITVEKMIEDLERKKKFVEQFAFMEPDRYWHYLHHLYPRNNFLVCALDIAAWDIYGKIRQQPLYKLWNLDMANAPLTDYTIGIDTIDKMVEKMKEKPWPIYKIKLGTPEDIAIVTALRKHTEAIFRVDANAGWTTEEALEKIPVLADLGVEMIEQPLAKDNWEGMKKLFAVSKVPLIADEACVVEQDVERCAGHFHGINIKLTKCSGITPALRMISKARSLNMKVMVGSMNESTVGSAAIAHLSPMLDYIDADGPLLLSEDIATGLTYEAGRVSVSEEFGLGIKLK